MIDVQSMQDSVSANALACKRPCAKIWHHYCASAEASTRRTMLLLANDVLKNLGKRLANHG